MSSKRPELTELDFGNINLLVYTDERTVMKAKEIPGTHGVVHLESEVYPIRPLCSNPVEKEDFEIFMHDDVKRAPWGPDEYVPLLAKM